MRIVAGRLGGRSLRAPESREVRPTSDRLRETIFNMLAHRFDDACHNARVIDLFAGTGALGLEAISRGAGFALFVDNGSESRALLRENIEALGLGGLTRVFRRDATNLGDAPAGGPFTLAFLDPPYGKGLAQAGLASLTSGGWLCDSAICVIEEAAGADLAIPEAFTLADQRENGATRVIFLRYEGRTGGHRNR